MELVEDFSAELIVPEIFREICSLLVSFNKICTLRAAKASEMDDQDELILNSVNTNSGLVIFVHLSAPMMFSNFSLTKSELIEIHTDTLAHSFRSDAGLMAMNDIRFKISHKRQSKLQTRLISVLMFNKNIDGYITKTVEQRMHGVAIESTLTEGVYGNIDMWVDLSIIQLDQLAKISDQIKSLNNELEISVFRHGELKISSVSTTMTTVSTFDIEFAQREDSSQQSQSGTMEISSCVVLAKDWCSLLHSRRLYRKVIIGVANDEVLVFYGFLRQGESLGSDSVNFYLQARHKSN